MHGLSQLEAVHILNNVDPTTVIDDNWFADGVYLTEEDCYILMALFKITELPTYKRVLDKFEGYTVPQLMQNHSIL